MAFIHGVFSKTLLTSWFLTRQFWASGPQRSRSFPGTCGSSTRGPKRSVCRLARPRFTDFSSPGAHIAQLDKAILHDYSYIRQRELAPHSALSLPGVIFDRQVAGQAAKVSQIPSDIKLCIAHWLTVSPFNVAGLPCPNTISPPLGIQTTCAPLFPSYPDNRTKQPFPGHLYS